MTQAKVKLFNNGNDWHLIKLEWENNEQTSFGFATMEDAKNAISFAKYCIENNEELKDVTVL